MADDVDFSQRTAGGLEDDQAERIVKSMRRDNPYWTLWTDPDKRREFTEQLRDMLNGNGRDTTAEENARVKQERPKSQLDRDNELWNSDEYKQIIPKKL
jgi:hypothetical protein